MSKAYCLQNCVEGPPPPAPPETKCRGRRDQACSPLEPMGAACVPLCTSDTECGTRKCDLGTGLCADVIAPGAPIGGACMRNLDCNGSICIPLADDGDGGPEPGVCTAACRLGNLEACGFRTGPLDAGPVPVAACLLATRTANDGDSAICAQLCDSVADCSVRDPRWTCTPDPTVQTAFRHNGFCWLGAAPPPVDAGGGG